MYHVKLTVAIYEHVYILLHQHNYHKRSVLFEGESETELVGEGGAECGSETELVGESGLSRKENMALDW